MDDLMRVLLGIGEQVRRLADAVESVNLDTTTLAIAADMFDRFGVTQTGEKNG